MRAGFVGRDLSKAYKSEIPECMGAVCAAVYLLTVIVFIPFPFYKDIVAATSGGGNRDVVVEIVHVSEGRFLHRFPHSKVSTGLPATSSCSRLTGHIARVLSRGHYLASDHCSSRYR